MSRTAAPAPAPVEYAPPPHDLDAERALLAAALHLGAVPMPAEDVTPADFYRPSHATLWGIMLAAATEGGHFDLVVLRDAIAAGRDTVEAERLREALREAYETEARPFCADKHAAIVRDKARLRKVLYAAQAAVNAARDGERPDAVIDAVRVAMLEAERDVDADQASILDLLTEAMDDIGNAQADTTVRTGYAALDEKLGPLEPGNVTFLGARPGMGKTALGLNIATNTAADGWPVLFMSAEMPRVQLGRRLLSTFSGIRSTRLRRGTLLTEAEWGLLADAKRALARLPVIVDDTSSPTIDHLRRSIRRAADKHGARLVVIDYIGLLLAPNDRTIRNRENQIGFISRAIKAAAKDFSVHVLAIAQLNREGAKENRDPKTAEDTKPPTLTDLRDSGSQEQDADAVLLLHRPGYYTKAPIDATKAELIIAKNRHGEAGKVPLVWQAEIQRFDNAPTPDGPMV